MSKHNTLFFKIVLRNTAYQQKYPDTNQSPYTTLMSRTDKKEEWGVCKEYDPICTDRRTATLALRGYVAVLADNGFKTCFEGCEVEIEL